MKQKLLKSLLLAAAMLIGSGNVWADEANLSPTADTYFDWGNASGSYGSAETLYCGIWQEMWDNATPGLKGTTSKIAVFKFDVSEFKGKITAATFKVTGTNPSTNTNTRSIYLGYFDLTSWTESTTASESGMNTRSATVLNIHPFGLSQAITKGATREVSFSNDALKDYLNNDADGIVSLIVYGVGQECYVNSKEAASGKPQLTLTYTEAAIHNYTINAVSGGTTIKELATGTCEEGGNFSTLVPKAILYSGQYYVLDDGGLTNYEASFAMSTSDVVEEVNYTLDESVVAFWECENMSYSHAVFNTTTNSNLASNGGAVTIYSDNDAHTTTTIGKGVYSISVAGFYWADNYADSFKLQYSTDNAVWEDIATISFAKAENAVKTVNNVIIPGNSYLRIFDVSGHTPRHYVDYLLVDKVADIIDADDEFVGAFDKSTDYATSGAYTLKKGETKVFTFQNHGQDFSKNWRINVLENSVWKSVTRADSWDETAGAATKVSYQVSKDGGSSRVALDWSEYQTDMDNARVVATLAYGLDGTLAITTTSTGESSGYIYYVDQDVTGLTQDLEIRLAVAYSWLEIISVETTAEPATMSIKANKWGTFIAPFDVTIPSGVEAYTVTGVSGTNLVKEAVETTIPANTPVIVKNTTGEDITQTFSGVVHSNDSYTEGYLTGVYTAATIAASDGSNTRYVLQTQSGVQAFYKVASDFTATPNKCYLTVPVSPAPVKAFFFGSDDADAIGDVRSKMEDGRNEIFNLAGQRLSKMQKGVNIINGKKVLVK